LFCCCCCFQTASSHFQTRPRSSNKLQHCVCVCCVFCVFCKPCLPRQGYCV
jgi:hypothetical protein